MERKQEKFLYEYLKSGNATEAYKRAGYSVRNDTTASANAWRLLRNERVQERLAEMRSMLARDTVACALERREFLTAVMRDNDTKTVDRLKAVDLMNRMDGAYVTKVAGADGGAIAYTLSWKHHASDDDEDEEEDEDGDE